MTVSRYTRLGQGHTDKDVTAVVSVKKTCCYTFFFFLILKVSQASKDKTSLMTVSQYTDLRALMGTKLYLQPACPSNHQDCPAEDIQFPEPSFTYAHNNIADA